MTERLLYCSETYGKALALCFSVLFNVLCRLFSLSLRRLLCGTFCCLSVILLNRLIEEALSAENSIESLVLLAAAVIGNIVVALLAVVYVGVLVVFGLKLDVAQGARFP